MRQFFHGLALPLHLLRALWADPVARRFYLRVGILQSLVIIALTVGLHSSGSKAADATERARRDSPADLQEAIDEEKEERERFKLEVKLAAEELERKVRAASGDEEQPAPGEQPAIRERAKSVTKAAKALAEAQEAREDAEQQEQGTIARLLGRIDREVQLWVALFGLMQLIQWCVIALSRDYHDVVSREASLLTALEPEDGPLTPRVRLDMQWLRKKFSRRIRALVVFLSGLPVLYAFTAPFPIRNTLLAVLVPAWSAYWLGVFTTARSGYAWKNSDAREPWFLRAWNWLTTRVPGFRWRFLQRYGLFWANRTRAVFPPAAELEKQPWAFAGLTVVGMLSMLPLAKCFLRPLIPVAAAHLLVAQQQADRAASPKHLEPPTQPPAASSTPT